MICSMMTQLHAKKGIAPQEFLPHKPKSQPITDEQLINIFTTMKSK